MRSNQKLKELCGEQDLVGVVKRGRFKWFDHLERMEQERIPRKILLYCYTLSRSTNPIISATVKIDIYAKRLKFIQSRERRDF